MSREGRAVLLVKFALVLSLQMGGGTSMGIAHLKMIDAGIPKDSLVLLTIPALPLQLILTVLLRRATSGPEAMHFFIKSYVVL